MTNIYPYIPILKCKKAEFKALNGLSDYQLKRITPLIQLIPKKRIDSSNPLDIKRIPRDKEDLLNEAILTIHKKLPGLRTYLDTNLLYSGQKNSAIKMIEETPCLLGNNIVPVLKLNDLKANAFEKKVLSFIQQGSCLRLTVNDIIRGFGSKVDILLSKLNIERKNIDLLIDLQITKNNKLNDVKNIIASNEFVKEWRTVYIASGAFPEDLSDYKKPGTYKEDRIDWKLWEAIQENRSDNFAIGFSDYTIQYPIYSELPENPNTSYSVRYTTKDKFVILKGVAINSSHCPEEPKKQYYAHAIIIKDSDYYSGKEFSKGDEYIYNIGDKKIRSLGDPTSWLAAGINHHMALTLNQLENKKIS